MTGRMRTTIRTQLTTIDGVRIDATHLPSDRPHAVILAHGFTGSSGRPQLRRIARQFRAAAGGGVVALDFRGHGRSGGRSTVGDKEIYDLDAAVAYARKLGYDRVATVGFSMGASVVLRHAALMGGLAAVVAVSGPGRWFYRGTPAMRRAHWIIESRLGRAVARPVLRTRISPLPWNPIPLSPTEAAAALSPMPLLIVHGDCDPYFPVDHAYALYEAAGEPRELWIEQGFGHAEAAASAALIDRIGRWLVGVAASSL